MRGSLFGRPASATALPASAAPRNQSFPGGGTDRPIAAPGRFRGNDPANRLPKAAADKLRRLREDQQQINAFLQDLSSRQSDENRRRLELAADVEQLKNSRTRSSRGGSTISPTYLSRGIPDGPVEHYA